MTAELLAHNDAHRDDEEAKQGGLDALTASYNRDVFAELRHINEKLAAIMLKLEELAVQEEK